MLEELLVQVLGLSLVYTLDWLQQTFVAELLHHLAGGWDPRPSQH